MSAVPLPASHPAPPRPWPRQACPVAAVQAALLLLSTGRADMARVVLEGLPGLLTRAERERLLAENEELRGRLARAEAGLAQRRGLQGQLVRTARELSDLKGTLAIARQEAPASRPRRPHQVLASALADGRTTAQRVAAVLRVDDPHVYEIASGRVGLSRGRWRRLLTELEVDAP